MTTPFDPQLANDLNIEQALTDRGGLSPGRLPATARLMPRTQIFLMQAPGGGLELGPASEQAVARASASSGALLPEDVRGRFESSLGTDLSGVRIHTGGESADAARSVNARAYTTGNDIHFADGQYQPADPFGLHLLAHEVAHTVQQGGRPVATQAKLEVSQRGDAAEVDADRAADAMIAGEATSIGHGFASSSRLMREEMDAKYYEWAADDGEKRAAQSGFQQSHATMGVVTASNVGDSAAADSEIAKIRESDDEFMKYFGTMHLPDERIKNAYGDNQKAVSALSDFTAESGVENTTITNFKVQYQRLMLDFERLSSMVAMSGINGDQSGDAAANELVKQVNPGAAESAAVHKDTDSPDAAGAGVIAVKRAEAVKWKEEMTQASAEIGPHELSVAAAQNAYLTACNEIAAGLVARKEPQAATDLKSLQATIDQIKGIAKAIAGLASKAVGGALGGVVTSAMDWNAGAQKADHDARGRGSAGGSSVVLPPVGMPYEQSHGDVDIKITNVKKTKGQEIGAAVGDGVAGKMPDIVGEIVALGFTAKLATAQAKADAALETQQAASKRAQMTALNEKYILLRKAAEDFAKIGAQLERAKNNYRRAVMEYARAADRTGGRNSKKMQTLAAFLGEADAYLAQSKGTIAIGNNEKAQAERTKDKRGKITLATGDDAIRWWDIKEEKLTASDGKTWRINKHDVKLPVGAKAKSAQGEGQGNEGAAATIEKEQARLEKNEDWIGKMRGPIAAQLNLG